MTGFTFHILKLNTITALIICAAYVVSRMTQNKFTCKWKYFVWLVTAFALLIPADLSSFSRVQLQIAQPTRQAGTRQTSENTTVADKKAQAASGRYLSSDGTAAENSSAPSRQTGLQDAQLSPIVSKTAGAGTSAAPLVFSLHLTQVSLYGFLQLFSCIWLTGFVLLASFRIFKYRFSLWSLHRWSSPVQNPDIIQLYRGICKRERIASPPKLMENRNLSTPVLAGLFHPALYLTEAPYTRQELAFILRHELTHYKRHDLWFKLLLLAVSTIYWFNPALYLMRSEAEKDIENLCDGRVLQASPAQSRLHYSQLLLKTAALQNHIPYLSASLNDSKLIFRERIHYLTELSSLRRGTPLGLVLCAFLLIGNFAVGSSVLPTQARSADLSPASDASAENSSSVLAEIDTRARANAAQNAGSSDGSPLSGTAAPASVPNVSADVLASASDLTRNGKTNFNDALNQSSSGQSNVSDFGVNSGSSPSSSDAAGSNTASPDDNAAPGSGQSQDITGNPNGTDNAAPVSGSGSQDTPGASDPGNQDNTPETSTPGNSDPGTGSSLPVLTDTRITLYALQETGATYVWQSSDGIWYDGDYRKYVPNGDDTFTCSDDQSLWTSETPPSPADYASDSVSLISEDGLNVNQLYYDSDSGIWQNIAGGIYTPNGDGTFTGPNGDLWIVTS